MTMSLPIVELLALAALVLLATRDVAPSHDAAQRDGAGAEPVNRRA